MPQNSSLIGIDALFQYTGAGAQLFSGALFYLILVRFFSSYQVGAIAILLAIVGLFNIVFSFGLGTAVQHFTSYHLGKGEFATARNVAFKILYLGLGFSAVGLVFMYYSAPYISIFFMHDLNYVRLVRILGIVLLGNIIFGILNGAALGLQLFRASGIMNVAIWTIYYFLAILLGFLFKSIFYVIVGWMAGIFVGVFLYLYLIIRNTMEYKGRPRKLTPSLLFQFSLPVLLSSIIGYGSSYIDRFIVAGLMTLSVLAVYNFALLISSSIGFIVMPLNNIMLPKFSEFYGEGNRETIRERTSTATTIISAIYVPAAIGVAVLSKMIMVLLAGTSYEYGYVAVSIVMISSAMFVSTNVMTQLLAAVRRTRIFIFSSLAALASNAIISVALIPKFGIYGAALGYSSVYASSFLILDHFSRRTGMFKTNLKSLTKIYGSSIVMALTVLVAESKFGTDLVLLPFYIGIGAAVYLSLAKILHILPREDGMIISSVFPEKMRLIQRVIRLMME